MNERTNETKEDISCQRKDLSISHGSHYLHPQCACTRVGGVLSELQKAINGEFTTFGMYIKHDLAAISSSRLDDSDRDIINRLGRHRGPGLGRECLR